MDKETLIIAGKTFLTLTAIYLTTMAVLTLPITLAWLLN